MVICCSCCYYTKRFFLLLLFLAYCALASFVLAWPDIWYVYVINGCSAFSVRCLECVSVCGSQFSIARDLHECVYAKFRQNRRCSPPHHVPAKGRVETRRCRDAVRRKKKKKKQKRESNWFSCLKRNSNEKKNNCQTTNSRRLTRGNMKRTKVYIFNLKGTFFFYLFSVALGLLLLIHSAVAGQLNGIRLWNLMWARKRARARLIKKNPYAFADISELTLCFARLVSGELLRHMSK